MNTIHFLVIIETLNYSGIWLKCIISVRVFKVSARVMQAHCPRTAFPLSHFYEACAKPHFPLCFHVFARVDHVRLPNFPLVYPVFPLGYQVFHRFTKLSTRAFGTLRFPLCFPRFCKGLPRPFTQFFHWFTQFFHWVTQFYHRVTQFFARALGTLRFPCVWHVFARVHHVHLPSFPLGYPVFPMGYPICCFPY